MSTKQETNIAISFYHIHNIITRGLSVSSESAQGILKSGFQGEGTREGFFNYVRSLTSVMNAHHLTEDNLAFPYFRDKLPEASFDDWTYWHGKMAEDLDGINLAMENVEKNVDLETGLKTIESALTRLKEGWPYHIQPETDEFINKADALVPVEESLRLVGKFSAYVLEKAIPLDLTVPFMHYNLSAEDRQVFAQWIPGEGHPNLVPVTSKEKAASMAAYLLK